MEISVESRFLRCWSPSLHSETKRQSWWCSCFWRQGQWLGSFGEGWPGRRACESWVVNLVTVQPGTAFCWCWFAVAFHKHLCPTSFRWQVLAEIIPWGCPVFLGVIRCWLATALLQLCKLLIGLEKSCRCLQLAHEAVCFNSFNVNSPGHRHRGCVIT